MKRITRSGGHRCRAWRLKKKYNKWFSYIIQVIIKDTLADLPEKFFENAWSGHTYEACRIYK